MQPLNKDGFPRKFGPYVLVKPLARGGMGALCLAVYGQKGMEKLCAVKTALPHLADKGFLQRFRDEAKVVVRLSHGNLVTVFDAGEVNNELFLALDFIEGKDLRAVWNRCAQRGKAFPIAVAVHVVKELLRGLDYAHNFERLSLVHRDVSPPNVLLSYTGEVKLADFGLATSILKMEKTAPGIIYGKVSYMAPEQARGESLDGRTDLYAAGIILWELLTGRQLFPPGTRGVAASQADSDDELLARVKHPEVLPPSRRSPRVPPELDALCLKALAPEPKDRFQTGEGFRTELAAYLAKTAPATDGAEVANFLRELFGDQITKERLERERMVLSACELLADSSNEKTPKVLSTQAKPKAPAPPPLPPGVAGAHNDPGEPNSSDLEDEGTRKLKVEEVSKIVGRLLGGRYRIKRLCGEGGMGRVYEAEHVEIGKRVAVKVLHPAYTRTPDVVERFRREARAASKVGHPNIVNVTDSGTTDEGAFFFVMEYIEGIELGLAVHREGPMAIPRALHIAEQMCDALQAAHDQGIIHRDLKPENVLLIRREGQEDFVKVLDFGIAKSAELEESAKAGRRLTRPGVAMGTPEYMAPEQAAGKPADPRSDIYALGSILYEMLTGSPPYDGENVMEILHKKANEAPKPIRELRGDVPPAVIALVAKTMARQPKERPQRMGDLRQDLRALRATLVPALTPEGLPVAAVSRSAPALPGLGTGSVLAVWGISPRAALFAAASLTLLGVVALGRVITRTKTPSPTVEVGGASPTPTVSAVPPALAPPKESPMPTALTPTPETAQPAAEKPAASEPRPSKPAPTQPGPGGVSSRKLLAEGQDLLKAQKYDEAEKLFSRLLTAKRERGAAYVGLGQIAFQQKRYADAARQAQMGAKAGGGLAARLLLGDAHFKLGNYEQAKDAYGAALKMDPQNGNAKHAIALIERRFD